MADTDTPPKTRRPPPPPSSSSKEEFSPSSPGVPIGTLQKKLAAMIGGIALPFAAAGDMQCAMLISSRAEPIAEAWANLAATSPPVRKVLESMLKGGAWAGAIGTTLPVIVGVASHHGIIPEQYAAPVNAVIFGPGPMSAPNDGESEESNSGENGRGFPPPPSGIDTPLA